MKLGIIGAGNMGKAIIDRLIPTDLDIFVSSGKEESYKGIKIICDNNQIAKDCDVLILAIKPQSMEDVLEEINNYVTGKLVLSIAAGLNISYYESKLNARVVRVMTNLAIKNGLGISAYKLGSSCTLTDKETVEYILGCLGKYIEVSDERLLDVMTAVSGSGIAYFLRIFSVFISSAESSGFDKETAEEIVLETVKGAVSLVENKSENCEDLIRSVSSKGGTTEQGLKEFDEKNLDGILASVIEKTIEKCNRIGDKNG